MFVTDLKCMKTSRNRSKSQDETQEGYSQKRTSILGVNSTGGDEGKKSLSLCTSLVGAQRQWLVVAVLALKLCRVVDW
jgi:hypothetical protein